MSLTKQKQAKARARCRTFPAGVPDEAWGTGPLAEPLQWRASIGEIYYPKPLTESDLMELKVPENADEYERLYLEDAREALKARIAEETLVLKKYG